MIRVGSRVRRKRTNAGISPDAGVVSVPYRPPAAMLSCSALTDPGAHRQENQDALLQRPEHGLWVVADGMGGHDRGALASRRVVEAFARMPFTGSMSDRVRAAQASIAAANDQIHSESRALGRRTLMGSTVAALVISDDALTALWAGDSRVYLFRERRLRCLTRDHSLAQQLVLEGRITPAAAQRHPSAHQITRAVGARAAVAVEQVNERLESDDVLLLCSDGLSDVVADVELATVLDDSRPEAAARELMALALERKARDNVTVMVVAN